MWQQSRIKSFVVNLYVLLDVHLLAIDYQANCSLAPYYMYSVGDKLNQICYLQWHCCVLLGQPVDGNSDC
jgi:hypothetical protein